MSKVFKKEFFRILDLFRDNDSFLFLKAADGELLAMENTLLDNNEFRNDNSVPQERRDELKLSLQYRHDKYYLGVMCPCCCHYDGRSDRMKKIANQEENHLTYANVFVNSNYPLFKELFIAEFKRREVWLVCHESSKISNLPFLPEKVFPIKRNAWVESYDLIEEMRQHNLQGKTVLFAAGPFGNILGHKLFQTHPNNRMVDVGSTLNPWTQSEGFRRDYYNTPEAGFGARECVWT